MSGAAIDFDTLAAALCELLPNYEDGIYLTQNLARDLSPLRLTVADIAGDMPTEDVAFACLSDSAWLRSRRDPRPFIFSMHASAAAIDPRLEPLDRLMAGARGAFHFANNGVGMFRIARFVDGERIEPGHHENPPADRLRRVFA